MQNNILTVLLIIAIGLFLLNVLILICLLNLKKTAKEIKFSIERYFDVNLKIQFLATTLFMAGIVITFLGWNIKSQIIQEIKSEVFLEIGQDVDSLKQNADSLIYTIRTLKENQKLYKNQLAELEKMNTNVQKSIIELDKQVTNRLSDINTLLRIFIVTDIYIDFNKDSTRLYFKALKPINSQKLPNFNNPPIVNIQSSSGMIFYIKTITNEFIDLSPLSSGSLDDNKITLWFIEQNFNID